MNEESERKLARNEALFRETNEAIERGLWPGEERGLVRFRCECARLDCREVIEIALSDYESVRKHPRRFIVIDGHVVPEIEKVIERNGPYLVIEKQGNGGDEADELDPRD